MRGNFSEDALRQYAELVNGMLHSDFSEGSETWDFTRCVRSDGSAYAIAAGKKCRKGTEQAADVAAPAAKKSKKVAAPKAPKAAAAKPAGAKAKPKAAAATAEAKPKASAPEPAKPKGKIAKLKELAGKLKDDVLAKLTKNPKAPPELKKAAEAELKKRAAKPEAKPEAKPKPKAEKKPKAEAKEKPAAKPKAEPKAKAKPGEKETLESLRAKGKSLMEEYNNLVNQGKFKEADKKIKEAMEVNKKIGALPEVKAAQAAQKPIINEGQKKLDEAAMGFRERTNQQYSRAEAAKITAAQKKAIHSYTEEATSEKFGYMHMNHCSRQPPTCPDPKQAKKFSADLDSALKSLPKNDQGEPFFRGIHVANEGPTAALYAALEKAQPGQKFKDPAYGSYSSVPGIANDFVGSRTRGIVFISRNKSLTPIAPFSELKDEAEAILPRGTEQTIRSVTRDKDILIIEVD
jgi:hypothetical protein